MIYGMDTEQVAALAAEMTAITERLHSLELQLTSELATTPWVGEDRTRFDREWHQQHAVALRQAADALTQAAEVAGRQVAEQDRASA